MPTAVAAAARLRWPGASLETFRVHTGQRSLAAAATAVMKTAPEGAVGNAEGSINDRNLPSRPFPSSG